MRIVPLRQTRPDDLTSIFSEEIQSWNDQLNWDYWPTLGVVKGFIRSGTLPGFAIISSDGTPIGYSYYVVDRPVAFIGDVYIKREYAELVHYQSLIETTVDFLCKQPHIDRVESQVFPLNFEFQEIFRSLGFEVIRRYFLIADLEHAHIDQQLSQLPDGYNIQAWDDQFAESGAHVIYDSYLNSPDLTLCHDYQSRRGCRRFLRNLVENPACGEFRRDVTLVMLDAQKKMCGILVATSIRKDTGMIPQLSIRTDSQCRGFGSLLLSAYMQRARQKGIRQVTLSVSESNQRAFRLYLRSGFQIRKEFHAFIWQRAEKSC